jgi:predicted aminopeptidase
VQQDERLRHLEQELKAARHEITKLKAVIGSSSIVEKIDVNDWIKPKNSKSSSHRFSAHDAFQLQLRNRFSMLKTDTLEAVQQSPGLLKQKDSGVNTNIGKLEREER